jgi:1,3-beta-glucan synthase
MTLAILAELLVHLYNLKQDMHPARPFLFLLATLALMIGPTFYIAIVENQFGHSGSLALLCIARLVISVVVTLPFRIMPSGRMFGDHVSKSGKYLASRAFAVNYPVLHSQALHTSGASSYGPSSLDACSLSHAFP